MGFWGLGILGFWVYRVWGLGFRVPGRVVGFRLRGFGDLCGLGQGFLMYLGFRVCSNVGFPISIQHLDCN